MPATAFVPRALWNHRMSTVAVRRLSPQEYLAIERRASTKSEYYRDEMFAMSGASKEHVVISGNIHALLWNQFRGRKCQVYGSDMRVKVEASGLYTYPDVSATCDTPRFDDEHLDTLLNPRVLVEVLSPTTAGYDRGEKFELYRKLESLQEYLVVAQDRVFVEHHVRQSDGSWKLNDYGVASDIVTLASIQCQLPLADVYDKVELAGDAPLPPGRV
jgi:Uma2 family endonuclease